jgi:hypothetical protein
VAEAQSKPSINPILVALTGVLAFFAIGVPKIATDKLAAPAGAKKDTTGEDHKEDTGKSGVLEALRDWWLGREQEKPEALFKSGKSALHETLRDWLSIGEDEDPETLYGEIRCRRHQILIATVPDPVDSKLGYIFDQVVAAIGSAVGEAGYSFDRSYLPWEIDKNRTGPRKAATKAVREEFPGVLLFRKAPEEKDPNELCIVLLIGENATTGMDKRPFARSLELIERIDGKESKHIQIVGPSFTGSDFSLRLALQDAIARYPAWHFDLVGAANGIDKKYFLNGLTGRVTYFATQVHTNQVTEAILYFLDQRNRSTSDEKCFCPIKQKVVLLVEASTAYGGGTSTPFVGPERTRDRAQPVESDKCNPAQVTVVHFPLHISRLRANYEKERRLKEEKLGLPPADTAVPLPEDQPNTQADIIPAQDNVTAGLTNDKVLANLLATVNREKTRYVGIVATDVWDQIFLGCYVRDHCPGVQLFFADSDTLLSHPEYSYYLKGTVIGSTYPLFPANRAWTEVDRRKGRRAAFPSPSAQAYYNGTLVQLGKPWLMAEYRPPRFQKHKNDEGVRARPPIWITMIGQNGEVVPLQYFDAYVDQDDYVWLAREPTVAFEAAQIDLPGPGLLVLLAGCLYGAWVLVVATWRRSPWLFWPAHPAPSLRSSESERWVYRLACLVTLCLLLAPLTTLSWVYVNAATSGKLLLLLSCVAVMVVFGMALLVLGVQFTVPVWRRVRPDNSRLRTAIKLAALAILVPGLIALARHLFPELDSWHALYLERAFNFASGVSPLLPLLFVCLALSSWAYFQLRGTWLLDHFFIPCPLPADGHGPRPISGHTRFLSKTRMFQEGCSLHEKLIKSTNGLGCFVAHHRLPVVILVGVTVFLGYKLHELYLPLLEGSGWGVFLFWALMIVLFLIYLNLVRLLVVWNGVKSLLNDLSLIPMMRAFDHLPARVSSVFGGYVLTQGPCPGQPRIPVQQARLLRHETEQLIGTASFTGWEKPLDDEQVGAGVLAQAHVLKDDLDVLLRQAEGNERTTEPIPEWLRNQLSRVAGHCLRILPWFWQMSSVDDAFGTDATSRPEATVSDRRRDRFDDWIQAAEALVATQIVIYLSQFFFQLRNLVWSVTCCSSLLLISATSYPFQPERLMLWMVMGTVAAVLGSIIYVLVRANYDDLLSRITRTTPNRFTFDSGFLSSFFLYVVPTLSILVIQLSGAFRFVLEPILRTFK